MSRFFVTMFAMKAPIWDYFTLTCAVCILSILVWLPFLLGITRVGNIAIPNASMQYVYTNFDGPLYVIPAKTWYNRQAFENLKVEIPRNFEYYAAHLPLYPMVIALFGPLIGFVKSSLFVTFVSTIFFAVVFYEFLRRLNLTKHPLLLTLVVLLVPRFLVAHSVPAPEPLFMALVLLSLLQMEKKQYLWAGVWGALAVATKLPGILLFIAYAFFIGEEYLKTRKLTPAMGYILLIPLALIMVFYGYKVQMGDFWAYFHTGGVVPMPYPFAAFNTNALWVGSAWLEEIVLYFAMAIAAAVYWQSTRYRAIFYFTAVFVAATSFVEHQDISRYLLPVVPLIAAAFEKQLTGRVALITLLLLLPALLLYAWNFITFNAMPISDWQALL